MKQIALYGKGGIGKSTTSANLSAALSLAGYDILQIGCDPKRDSTRMLMQGRLIPTVMDLVHERGAAAVTPADVVYAGFNGVRCVEAGGPEPGVGCPGGGSLPPSSCWRSSGHSPGMSSYTTYWVTWSAEVLQCRCGKDTRRKCIS